MIRPSIVDWNHLESKWAWIWWIVANAIVRVAGKTNSCKKGYYNGPFWAYVILICRKRCIWQGNKRRKISPTATEITNASIGFIACEVFCWQNHHSLGLFSAKFANSTHFIMCSGCHRLFFTDLSSYFSKIKYQNQTGIYCKMPDLDLSTCFISVSTCIHLLPYFPEAKYLQRWRKSQKQFIDEIFKTAAQNEQKWSCSNEFWQHGALSP